MSSENTKDAQISTAEARQRKSSEIWDAGFHSPYSLDSPSYCPSEADGVVFSDVSSNDSFTSCKGRQSPQILASNTISSMEDGETTNIAENMDVDKITQIQVL